MSLDFTLAIWGAIVSTILALIRILEFRSGRRKIKITVKGGYKVIPPVPPYGDKTHVRITAANIGKRPVTVVGAALLLPRKKDDNGGALLCPADIKSIELREGQSRDFMWPEEELKQDYGLQPEKYVAQVWDATGRVYWSHNMLIRLVKLGRIR